MDHVPDEPAQARPYGGAADAIAGGVSLARRFRRHADSLARHERSPLYIHMMRAAADDLDAQGIVFRLFAGVPVPPGSVPQLRLLAALHHLVLAGRARELARFYPSAGGELGPDGAWTAALAAIEEHFDWIGERLRRTVQTNEPGRATVLFAALIWLADQYRRPIRLLELGASAGLNLLVDRYCYVVGGQALADQSSPVRFIEPWQPGPLRPAAAAAAQLRIVARAGCDLAPLDPRTDEGRVTLLSYIWPDELERVERMRAALDLAVTSPMRVDARAASEWLPDALARRRPGELTVVWQSIFRQYLAASEWAALKRAFHSISAAQGSAPVVWLTMEPSRDHLARVKLALRRPGEQSEQHLAWCGDHGPPVVWQSSGDNQLPAGQPFEDGRG